VRQNLRQRLALTSRKAAYVYIHGYNNTFADGVLVIAELWHFLGRQGVPILYTWPAGAGGGCVAIPATANRGSSPSFT
jgi:esterase/lipase superfamily enzyme